MAKLYPENIDPTKQQIDALTSFFKNSYKKIVKEIETATDFGVANRKAILRQVDGILEELGTDVQEFIDQELPPYYKQGADDAVRQLKNIGADIPISSGFSQLHKQAIVALVDDTVSYYFESITGVKRSAARLLGKSTRNLVAQEIAQGQMTGDALKKVRQQIKGILQEEGLSALTDKAGRKWDLDRYSDMLFRTKVVEARNMGLGNRLVENGYDLAQVSSHFTSCPICAPWQGKIISITGNTHGYPTLAEAEADGLFHPNCRHAINAVIPSLASRTKAYNTKTGKYDDSSSKSLYKDIEKNTDKIMISKANEYNPEFKKNVKEVAKIGNWEFGFGPVKKVERSTEKIINDYGGDIMRLKDANRSVLFLDNPWDKKEYEKMKAAVKDVFGTEVKDKIGLDRKENYKNNMINPKTPDGRVVEIQVTTKEMWEAKIKMGGDKLYHEWRSAPVNSKTANETYAKMVKLYAQAEEKTRKRLGL